MAVLLAFLAWAAIGGWALMLGFGIVHHEVAVSVPAIGYGPAFALALVATIVSHFVLPTRSL